MLLGTTVAAITNLGSTIHLQRAGVTTTGTVVDHDYVGRRGYAPVVEFETQGESGSNVTFHLSEEDRNEEVHPVGSTVTVRYDPQNPSKTATTHNVVNMVIWLLCFLFSLPMFVFLALISFLDEWSCFCYNFCYCCICCHDEEEGQTATTNEYHLSVAPVGHQICRSAGQSGVELAASNPQASDVSLV